MQVAPLWRAGFVYEDTKWDAGCVASASWSVRAISSPRAVTKALWCAQRGQSALAYHAVNVGLHLIVGVLVAALVWTVTQGELVAWLAAGLWLLHPLNMETIAYLSARGELIAAIGVLGACLCALGGYGLAAVGLGLFGVMGKESAVVSLGLVPLVLWFDGHGARYLRGGLLLLVTITVAAAWLYNYNAYWSWSWPLLQASALTRMIGMTVLPYGQTIDYDYERVAVVFQAAAACALIGLAWLAVRLHAAAPLVAAGVAWVLIAALPRFLVSTPRSILNEHQFYLPLVGFAFIVAGALSVPSFQRTP